MHPVNREKVSTNNNCRVEFIIDQVDNTKATCKGKKDADSTLGIYSGGFP